MSDNATPLILLTRPRAAAERFGALCQAEFGTQAQVVIAPLMEIVPKDAPILLEGIDGLIFTSDAAVRVFAAQSPRRDLPAWCVGDQTAKTARAQGLQAWSAKGAADDLIAQMVAAGVTGRWRHLHGQHVRGDIAMRLTTAGISTTAQAIYDQQPVPPPAAFFDAMTSAQTVLAPLFSPRSATLFAEASKASPTQNLRPIALSQAVLDALPPNWQAQSQLVQAPTAPAMIGAIRALISP